MDKETISTIKGRVEFLRKGHRGVFSGGFWSLKAMSPTNEDICHVCAMSFNSSGRWVDKNMVPYTIYNANGINGTPNEMSLAWLKFILDPELSFCKEALPFLVEANEPEWINSHGGVVFAADCDAAPAAALKAFVIALRYCDENYKAACRWYELVQLGIDPRIAYAISARYKWDSQLVLKDKAQSPNANHEPFGGPVTLWLKEMYRGTVQPEALTVAKTGAICRPEGDYYAGYVGKSYYAIEADDPYFKVTFGKTTIPEFVAQLTEMVKDA